MVKMTISNKKKKLPLSQEEYEERLKNEKVKKQELKE